MLSLPPDFVGGDRWELTSDARFIYERLLERLDQLRVEGECDEALLVELVDPDLMTVDDGADDGGPDTGSGPDDLQELAARRAVEPGIRFTWGPPGTGKTRVLGKAVASAAVAGSRVLVLAHANVAVDVAIQRIADELGDDTLVRGGRVVRVGTPQSGALSGLNGLLPHDIAGAACPGLTDRIAALGAELHDLSDQARLSTDVPGVGHRISAVRDELKRAKAELDDGARLVIDEAVVVATTLARAVVDEQLWSSHFDIIVIDEASMAPLPIVLALVMRGATTVSIFGDFRQLPPVAVSDHEVARAYFDRDVFEYGQVVHLHERGAIDPRLTTLTTQFRMGEGICAVVNDLAYDHMLRTAPTARDAAVRAAERGIGPGAEMVVVDTSSLQAICEIEVEPASWSRVNLRHAVLAASIAQSLRSDDFSSVGVISPYRAQAQLLASLVRSAHGIEVATIHRFQGSECDAIVLDLTDARPIAGPSRLTGVDGDLARRLLNVAISRARHKLVVLADRGFLSGLQPSVAERMVIDLMDDHVAEAADGLSVARAFVDSDGANRSRPGAAGPVWTESWRTAGPWLEQMLPSGTVLEANVVGDANLAEFLVSVEGQVRRSSDSIVRTASACARTLEPTTFDVRLQVRGQTPWVIIDERLVAIGAGPGGGPIAVSEDAHVARALRRALARKES